MMSVEHSNHIDRSPLGQEPEVSDAVRDHIPTSPLTAVTTDTSPLKAEAAAPAWQPPGTVVRAVGTAATASEAAHLLDDDNPAPQPPTPKGAVVNEVGKEPQDAEIPPESDAAATEASSASTGPQTGGGGKKPPSNPPTDRGATDPDEPGEPPEPTTDEQGNDDADATAELPVENKGEATDAPEEAAPRGIEHIATPQLSRLEVLDAEFGTEMRHVVDMSDTIVIDADPRFYTQVAGVVTGEYLDEATAQVQKFMGLPEIPPQLDDRVSDDTVERVNRTLAYCMSHPERPEEFAIQPAEGKGFAFAQRVIYPSDGGRIEVRHVVECELDENGLVQDNDRQRHVVTVTNIQMPSQGGEEEALHAEFMSQPESEAVLVGEIVAMTPHQVDLYHEMVVVAGIDFAEHLVGTPHETEAALAQDLAMLRRGYEEDGCTTEEAAERTREVKELVLAVQADRLEQNGLYHDRFDTLLAYLQAVLRETFPRR